MRAPRWVRVLAVLVAREVQSSLAYRMWVVLLQLSNLVVPVVSLLVWTGAIALGARPPVSRDFLVTWFVLVSVVSMLTSSWTAEFLAQEIRLGHLSRWLVRPCSTHWNGLANNVGEKVVKLVALLPMVAVLGLACRRWLHLPTDPARWLLALAAVVIAAGIAFCLDIVVGSLAFWFEDVSGVNRFRQLLANVFSGAIVPLALFPASMGPALRVQPFRFVLSFPLEVLLGTAGPLTTGFVWALGWFAAVGLLARTLWVRGLRGYQAAGA